MLCWGSGRAGAPAAMLNSVRDNSSRHLMALPTRAEIGGDAAHVIIQKDAEITHVFHRFQLRSHVGETLLIAHATLTSGTHCLQQDLSVDTTLRHG